MPVSSSAKSAVSGVIKNLTFHNDDNGYTIARIDAGEGIITVVGNLPAARVGAGYEFIGSWVVHPKYGEQFAFVEYEETVPESEDEISAFLASGAIKGIGPKMAGSIVERFGDESLDILENRPHLLLDIEGIGEKKLEAIVASFEEHREFAKVVFFFKQYGISAEAAMRMYREYGDLTIEAVSENPYRLISDIHGIGFKTADAIAAKMGIGPSSEERIKSGILYVLGRYVSDGNTCAPRRELIDNAVTLLDVSGDEIEDAFFSMCLEGRVEEKKVDGAEYIFPCTLYMAESGIAAELRRLMSGKPVNLMSDMGNMVTFSEADLGIVLSESQREAIDLALSNRVFIITGGPGTGKTTIIRAVLDIFAYRDADVKVAAPTGRAAKRITEATGYPAVTIHRMLEYSFDDDSEIMHFGRNKENMLETDAVIIDEASMIDVQLMDALLKAIPSRASLIIVGDADQLPSVGAGNVLGDMLSSECIPSLRLTDIYRQSEGSGIVYGAHNIIRGDYPEMNAEDSDFFLLKKRDSEQILAAMIDLIVRRLPSYAPDIDPASDIQVLTPVRKGTLGTINLNSEFQRVLNPPSPEKTEKRVGNRIFREGDRVMQIKNNYALSWVDSSDFSEGEGVFNGDMGRIEKIDNDAGFINVVYEGSRHVNYDFSMLEEIEHAFAVTIHKSQGSEFPAVIIPLYPVAPMLMTRNLIYTAITRGKRIVVTVGREDALRTMIDNAGGRKRNTALKGLIRSCLSENLSEI